MVLRGGCCTIGGAVGVGLGIILAAVAKPAALGGGPEGIKFVVIVIIRGNYSSVVSIASATTSCSPSSPSAACPCPCLSGWKGLHLLLRLLRLLWMGPEIAAGSVRPTAIVNLVVDDYNVLVVVVVDSAGSSLPVPLGAVDVCSALDRCVPFHCCYC